MTQTSILMLTIAILLALMVGSVGAADIVSKGSYSLGLSRVEVRDANIEVIDPVTGVSIISTYYSDDVRINPSKEISIPLKDQLLLTRFEESTPITDVHFSFANLENGIKETIILDNPRTLTFPLVIPENTKIQKTGWGAYQIVRNDIPITGGIEISKPYGYDANGYNISMDFVLTDTTLTLVMDKNSTSGTVEDGNIKLHPIVYPIVIDPTTQVFAGWSARMIMGSVITPNSSIVIMGGFAAGCKTDVWVSVNGGVNWTQVNATAWSNRDSSGAVALSDSSIVIMGGDNNAGTRLNDTWISTNNGTLWTQQTASAGWVKRYGFPAIVTSNNSIVIMGGYEHPSALGMNDTWMSTNKGVTWTRINSSSGWSKRAYSSAIKTQNGSIVLMGGEYDFTPQYNDTWMSVNNGSMWSRINSSSGWEARNTHASVVTSTGSILLIGGNNDVSDYNDTWISRDNGITWSRQSASAGWTARQGHSAFFSSRLNATILMGGMSGSVYLNDVWWSYDEGVTWFPYPNGYPYPTPSFTQSTTTGTPALLVVFTDTSSNVGGSTAIYNWSFGDTVGTDPYSDVVGSVSHVYAYAGIFTPTLTITNDWGSATYTGNPIAVSNEEQKLNTLYLKEVRFNIVDQHGKPIESLQVSAQMMNSSNDGTNWYSTLYGMSSSATPIEGTLVMGMTDSFGSVVYAMVGTGLYELNMIDVSRGIIKRFTVHPTANDYTIVVPTTASASIPSIGDFITGNLTVSPQGANVYLNMTYNDTGLQTTNINYFVVFPNQTTFYTKNFAGTPAYNQSINFSYPVTNTRGDSYVWGYSATNSVWGLVNRSQGITLKGVDGILFNPFVYKDRW